MRKLLSLLFAVMLSVCCLGQTDKNVVYDCVIGKIDYQQPAKKSAAEGVLEAVSAGVSAATGSDGYTTKDQPMYEQSVREAILAGISRARRLVVANGTPAGDRPVLNISAHIATIQSTSRMYKTESIIDKKESYHDDYRGLVTGSVVITDAKTGDELASINIGRPSIEIGWCSTVEDALQNAVQYVQSTVTKQLNQLFPIYANIVEGSTAKKDKQKEVYINVGQSSGISKGTQFYVYQTTTVAGKEAKKEIGRLKVSEVMGDDVSLCKVTKGGKDIKNALDAGTDIQIMTKD